MDKEFIVSPKGNFIAIAISDSADGGFSSAKLVTTDTTWELHYELEAGIPYPYTTLSLVPSAQQGFMDLSSYDSIVVRAYLYDSKNPKGRVRVQLRNINPAYTVPGQLITLKYNELQYSPVTTPYPARFIWADFRVPSWWLDKVPVSYELARTEVNQVTRIDFTTPEVATSGTLVVQSVSFLGKRIPPTIFYQGLLGLWILVAIVLLIIRAWNYSDTLKLKEKREKELVAVNEALEIKTTKLTDMAQTDPLTGLLNRFGLQSHLKQALEQVANNPSRGLSVIIADIDFFKKINDTKGHAEGDEVLKKVASLFQKNTRSHDAVARWGGEEFLILCPQTRIEVTIRIAEKLRAMVENSIPGVTCSFGVSEWSNNKSVTELINQADLALYKAKRQGRNQVQSTAN